METVFGTNSTFKTQGCSAYVAQGETPMCQKMSAQLMSFRIASLRSLSVCKYLISEL